MLWKLRHWRSVIDKCCSSQFLLFQSTAAQSFNLLQYSTALIPGSFPFFRHPSWALQTQWDRAGFALKAESLPEWSFLVLVDKLGTCVMWPSFILHTDVTTRSGGTATKAHSLQLTLAEGDKIIIRDLLRQTWWDGKLLASKSWFSFAWDAFRSDLDFSVTPLCINDPGKSI